MKCLRTIIFCLLPLLLLVGRCRADSADVLLPASITFIVTDVEFGTLSTPQTTNVGFWNGSISLNKSVRISIKADDANFTAPSAGGDPIPAMKATWVTTDTIGGSGYAGVLSSVAYTRVFQANVNGTWGGTKVGWTLAPLGASVTAGDHTLTATWRVESL